MMYFTPVIHVKDLAQTTHNVEICVEADTYGFFLVNHRIPFKKFLPIINQVRKNFPYAWIGVNVLDEHPLTVIPQLPLIQGFWTDDPCLIEGQETQDLASVISKSIKYHLPSALYFGSVAFKYQVQPKDLASMTELACKYIDVITTSGDRTGDAADMKKVEIMYDFSTQPLAIASGIDINNVREYFKYIDWFLVNTHISIDSLNLNPELVRKMWEMI